MFLLGVIKSTDPAQTGNKAEDGYRLELTQKTCKDGV